MDPAEPNLKVTDRRHFTAEGELKPELSATETVSAPVPASEPSRSEASIDEAPSAHGEDAGEAVSFSSFIVSLGTQAADYIGGEHRDLGAARQMISALEMLKDKSEGRRTDDESRIIEAILFDLRLAFVGASRGPKS